MKLRSPTRLLLLLGALAACRPEAAGTSTATGPGEASGLAEQQADRQRFLAVYLSDQQVGGVETSIRHLPDGSIQVKDRFSFTIRRVNGGEVDDFSLETRSLTEYAPDLSLRFEESIKTEAGVVEKTTETVEGDVVVLTYEGPAQSFRKEFPIPEGFRSSRAVFSELVAEHGRTGAPAEREYTVFSPDEQRFVRKKLRIEGQREVTHGDQTLIAYDIVDTSEDGTVIEMVCDSDYLPISMDMFGTFTARWVDEAPFEIDTVASITSEIPVSGEKIVNWWQLERMNLTVTVKGDDPQLPSLWESGLYHQVKRDGDRYTITLEHTRPDSPAGKPSIPIAPEDADIARFLEPTPLSQSDDKTIRATARRIVGDERDSVMAGAHIVRWVYENLDKKSGVRGSATATEVLASGAGDCTEHAALTVALARAAGIPARNVDGIVFLGKADGEMMAGYHAWAELWVGEWIAVDAVFAEVGTGARYLSFGYNEPGMPGSGADLSRTVGKIAVTIDDYTLFAQ